MKIIPFLMIVLTVLTGCGGGTTEKVQDVSVQLGIDQLADNDYQSAKTIFCTLYEEVPTNSQAAFGCAMTSYIALGESDPIKAILAGAGESPVNMSNDIMADNKLFDIMMSEYYGAGTVDVTDFSYLPVVSFISEHYWNKAKIVPHLIYKFVQNSYTLQTLQTDLMTYANSLESIHNMLEVVKGDSSFSFSIPSEFFFTNDDITILPADILIFDLAVQGQRFVLALQNKYKADYDISKLNETETDYNIEELVNSLNGAYGTIFGTLKDSSADWSDIKPLFEEILSDAKTAVTAIRASGATNLFADIVADYSSEFDKTETLLNEIETSLNDGMTPLTISDGQVSVNIKKLFTNPPDAAKLTDDTPDPFDYVPSVCTTHEGNCCEEYEEEISDNSFCGLSPSPSVPKSVFKGATPPAHYCGTARYPGECESRIDEELGEYVCYCTTDTCVESEAYTYQTCTDEEVHLVENFFKDYFSGLAEFDW